MVLLITGVILVRQKEENAYGREYVGGVRLKHERRGWWRFVEGEGG